MQILSVEVIPTRVYAITGRPVRTDRRMPYGHRRATASYSLLETYSPYLYACPVPLVVFLLLTLAIFCSAQDRRAPGKNPFQNNPQAAETGRAMFRIYCAPCHGIPVSYTHLRAHETRHDL